MARIRRIGVLVALALSCLAASAPSALADASVNWGSGLVVAPPANAGPNPQEVVKAVSCATAGNCVAVGIYQDASGGSRGLIASQTGGHWSTGPEPTLPPNANSDPEVGLTGVSCASAQNCTAIGHFVDLHGVTQGLVVTETNGHWGTGREVYHPQGVRVTFNPRISLNSISCPTPNDCAIVGTYLDNTVSPQGILVTKNGGIYQAYAQAAPPANAAAEPVVSLNSVSCGAAGECTAVGSYVDTSGDTQGLMLTETGGNWQTGIEATLPAGANTNPSVVLNSVSCPSAGECAAVGEYNDTANNTQGLLLTETAGSWQTGTKAALPAGAGAAPAVTLNSVSCSSSGNCAAVGGYNDTSSNLQGLLLDETSGTWDTGVRASLPANAGSTVFVELLGVSCFANGQCAAVGNYTDNSFAAHPLLLSEGNGSWANGIEGSIPYVGSTPQASVESLACVPGGDCVASVDYLDNQNNSLAATINGTPSPPSNPALTLSPTPPSTDEAGTAIPASAIGATLSAGSGETGTVTFKVFGPQSSPPTSCANGGTNVGTATVQGDGSYISSSGFTPPAGGDYWWYASYDGDLGNSPAGTTCGAGMAETVVSTPALSLSVPSTSPVNATIPASSIGATLSGATASATGTITYTVYGPQRNAPTSCTSGGTPVGTASVQGNGTYTPSSDFTPSATGNYWWYVSYSGDASNPPATSSCGALMAETVVPASPSLTLKAPSATGAVGTAISPMASALLSGGSGETGTITFSVFGPQSSPPASCTSGGSTAGTVTVQGDGTYTQASGFVPGAPGDYWWYASYSGDQGDNPAVTTCGSGMAETVVKASPGLALSAPSSGTAGTTIHGSSVSATLAGGSGETGSLHFVVFGPQASAPSSCRSGGTSQGTANVHGNGSYTAPSDFTPSVPGHYWWYTSYSGDSGNAPETSACGSQMPETVVTASSPPGGGGGSNGNSSPVSTLSRLKTRGDTLRLTLSCTGTAAQVCSDRLTLTLTERLAGGQVLAVTAARRRQITTGVVTVATATVSLAAGQSRSLSIRLNRVARTLLGIRRRLPARLQLVQGHEFQTQSVIFHTKGKRRHR